jgi:hypothetical protein
VFFLGPLNLGIHTIFGILCPGSSAPDEDWFSFEAGALAQCYDLTVITSSTLGVAVVVMDSSGIDLANGVADSANEVNLTDEPAASTADQISLTFPTATVPSGGGRSTASTSQ